MCKIEKKNCCSMKNSVLILWKLMRNMLKIKFPNILNNDQKVKNISVCRHIYIIYPLETYIIAKRYTYTTAVASYIYMYIIYIIHNPYELYGQLKL